jgi:hypothetical protein
VFHYIPWFGSAAYYGEDPYKFFFECREKVCAMSSGSLCFHTRDFLVLSIRQWHKIPRGVWGV